MAILRKSAGAAVIAALFATSATPALARGPGGWNSGGWGGHYGGWRHRRDRGGISGGDVLAGILIIGGVAAIAAAAKKDQDRKRGERNPGDDYPDRPYDNSNDEGADGAAEDAAVDACAFAAEDRASGKGDMASVREILRVDPADDGWKVEGLIETRRGYRDDHPNRQRFTCSYRYGQVQSVQIDSGVAWR